MSSTEGGASSKDRDEKLRLARERQNEERQRKIEELKAQAEAAQRYREQKEEERRRRLDEIRHRDIEKRQQVEERKKAILEAEKERREYILKKNQERESKLQSMKRERNSIAFAFGSSTPRLLEPAEFGMVSSSTFWGQRRSTSISNVAGATLSRRSSERELNDSANKKHTNSSTPGERHHEGSRSGNVTPGGSINVSRPGSAMSTSTNVSATGSSFITRRSGPPMRKPRPASIAGTGVSLEEINKLKKDKPPVKSAASSGMNTPKRMPNMMSTSMIVTSSSRLSSAEKKTPLKKESPVVTSKSVPAKPLSKTTSSDRLNKLSANKNLSLSNSNSPSALMTKSAIILPATAAANANSAEQQHTPNAEEASVSKDEKNALNAVKTEEVVTSEQTNNKAAETAEATTAHADEKIDHGNEKDMPAEATKKENGDSGNLDSQEPNAQILLPEGGDMMSASMIAKSKITTEAEAKAALAERRRLAREQLERQAELERQRLEAERLAELKRQEEEAERQRLFEEESMRLAAEQRRAEEERLQQAIQEAEQREEEEQRKRLEEERQKQEREEAERKAKEEAEKQRLEVAERLKREEKDREERRKRVEAIMSRTRKGGSTTNTPNNTPAKENADAKAQQAQQQPETKGDAQPEKLQAQPQQSGSGSSSTEENNTSSSSGSSTNTIPTPTNATIPNSSVVAALPEQQINSQALYEQSVLDREAELMKSFSTVLDENTKNLQQLQMPSSQPQKQQLGEISNGKMHDGVSLQNTNNATTTTTSTVTNRNGHIENISNKNEINILQDVTPAAQLIDFGMETQDINNTVNFNNNNNNLLSNALVSTGESNLESKDVSLL